MPPRYIYVPPEGEKFKLLRFWWYLAELMYDESRNIFSFSHQMGICAKNYKNLPSTIFMGINGLRREIFVGKVNKLFVIANIPAFWAIYNIQISVEQPYIPIDLVFLSMNVDYFWWIDTVDGFDTVNDFDTVDGFDTVSKVSTVLKVSTVSTSSTVLTSLIVMEKKRIDGSIYSMQNSACIKCKELWLQRWCNYSHTCRLDTI